MLLKRIFIMWLQHDATATIGNHSTYMCTTLEIETMSEMEQGCNQGPATVCFLKCLSTSVNRRTSSPYKMEGGGRGQWSQLTRRSLPELAEFHQIPNKRELNSYHMCVCICVCMCMYVYVCVCALALHVCPLCTCVHVHMLAGVHVYMCVTCVHVCMCTCVYI